MDRDIGEHTFWIITWTIVTAALIVLIACITLYNIHRDRLIAQSTNPYCYCLCIEDTHSPQMCKKYTWKFEMNAQQEKYLHRTWLYNRKVDFNALLILESKGWELTAVSHTSNDIHTFHLFFKKTQRKSLAELAALRNKAEASELPL